MHSFNVAYDPWIPVRIDGKLEPLSLEQTLLRAHEIERIEDASPLVTGALYRLLLAALHRALQGPRDASECADLFEEGEFPADPISSYLNVWSDAGRFDLFDETRPFYQVGGFEGKLKSVANLAAELASGSNKLLFDHSMENVSPELSPAEAARLLVARQMMAIPEGAGYSPSPVGGAALVIPLGDTLFETLCLNLVPYVPTENDKPVWESDKAQPDAEQMILGLTHRYTWVSRLIRLVPETRKDTYGEKIVVTSLHYSAACKLLSGDAHDPDPMLAYRVGDAKTGALRAVNLRKDRALWRDFTALLPQSGDEAPNVLKHAFELLQKRRDWRALPVMVVGATNDKAKFEFWRLELYRLPASFIDRREDAYNQLTEALTAAEDVGSDLRKAAYILAKNILSHGERDPDRNDVSSLTDSFPTMQVYWSELGKAFPELLGRLGSAAPRDAQQFWTKMLFETLARAWSLTRKAAGDDAYALRAIYSAERLLSPTRRQLLEQLASFKEVTPI